MERTNPTAVILPLLAALALAACSKSTVEDTAEDELDDEWREVSFTIPPYPQSDDLVEFEADAPGARHTYFLDLEHLSIGQDGVWRYTVVIETSTGARNVMFEGLRCGVREYKTYAVGSTTGKLQKVRTPTWRSAQMRGPMAYRTALINDYLCDDLRWPVPREKVVARFKQGWWGLSVDRMENQPQGDR